MALHDTLIQIIPAEGWSAVFSNDDGSEFSFPLVCWAIVEPEDGGLENRYVDGISGAGNLDGCTDATSFVRYQRTDTLPPYEYTKLKNCTRVQNEPRT